MDRLLAVRVCVAAGVGEQMEARILDDDSAFEELGQGAADLAHAFAVEDHVGEAPVDLDRTLEPPVLGVDDPLEQRRHEVDKLHIGGDGEEGHFEPVGLGDHLGRQLAQVGKRTHDQARSASLGDPSHEADLRVDVVLDRKAACKHEVAGPGLNLRRLHQADPFDLPVEAFGAGDELGCGKDGAHRLAHRGARCFDLRFHPLGRH